MLATEHMRVNLSRESISYLRRTLTGLVNDYHSTEAASVLGELNSSLISKGEELDLVARYQVGSMDLDDLNNDGDINVDQDAEVSLGDGGGSYVAAWVWVPATKVMPYCDDCGEHCEEHGTCPGCGHTMTDPMDPEELKQQKERYAPV